MVRKFEVFLSSNQTEFEKKRRALGREISNMPRLSCVPQEYSGPKPHSPLTASLEGVKKCHIFIAILGEKDSDIVKEEIREAIRLGKYCMTYAKKTKKRDRNLEDFLSIEMQGILVFDPFTTKKKLCSQIIQHLEEHLDKIIELGFEAHTNKILNYFKKTKEEENKIQKEIKDGKQNLILNLLTQAKTSLDDGDYLSSVTKTGMFLELLLRNVIRSKGYSESEFKKSIGWLIGKVESLGILDKKGINEILEISYMRNNIVHQAITPTKYDAERAIKLAHNILEKLYDYIH